MSYGWYIEMEVVRTLIRNASDLLRMAGEPVNPRTILAVLRSAPTHSTQADDADWRSTSYCHRCHAEADRRHPDDQRVVEIGFHLIGDFPDRDRDEELTFQALATILEDLDQAMERGGGAT